MVNMPSGGGHVKIIPPSWLTCGQPGTHPKYYLLGFSAKGALNSTFVEQVLKDAVGWLAAAPGLHGVRRLVPLGTKLQTPVLTNFVFRIWLGRTNKMSRL